MPPFHSKMSKRERKALATPGRHKASLSHRVPPISAEHPFSVVTYTSTVPLLGREVAVQHKTITEGEPVDWKMTVHSTAAKFFGHESLAKCSNQVCVFREDDNPFVRAVSAVESGAGPKRFKDVKSVDQVFTKSGKDVRFAAWVMLCVSKAAQSQLATQFEAKFPGQTFPQGELYRQVKRWQDCENQRKSRHKMRRMTRGAGAE